LLSERRPGGVTLPNASIRANDQPWLNLANQSSRRFFQQPDIPGQMPSMYETGLKGHCVVHPQKSLQQYECR
jgi:hypothetical protein